MTSTESGTSCNLSALYKYLNGRPLWTTERIEHANALFKRRYTFVEGTKYTVLNIDGNEQELVIPTRKLPDQEYFVVLKDYHDLARSIDNSGNFEKEHDAKALYTIRALPRSAHQRNDLCQLGYAGGLSVLYEECWSKGLDHSKDLISLRKKANIYETSMEITVEELEEERRAIQVWKTTHDKLVRILKKHEDVLKRVDQVVCLGLGSLNVQRARPWLQHMAAQTVSQEICKIIDRGVNKEGVRIGKIKAQDPDYCDTCKLQLARLLKADTILTDFSGFRTITERTFVICIAPSAPILQIVADLTAHHKGPLAMLCDPIEDDFLKFENTAEEPAWDESSKALVEYKENCFEEDFSDYQDIMETGLSRKDFEATMPPLAKHLEKAEDKLNSKKIYAKAIKVNFGELKLYIRKP